jgi:DeoR/GlpR family transcriptional regulator of sugar metabolism/outer membrane receptor for ferric coprogen and ferric-rhodotorulic acid
VKKFPSGARQAIIRDRFAQQPGVSIAELAREFGVSEMTIRRDLDVLEGKSQIQRTHGGAVLTERMMFEFDYRERRELNRAAKCAIAAEARKLVKRGQRLILDNGTTTLELASLLKDGEDLTVITPSLAVASELQHATGVEVILLGGILREGSPDLTGPVTEHCLEIFSADIAFQGADAIGTDGAIYNSDLRLARVDRADAADRATLLHPVRSHQGRPDGTRPLRHPRGRRHLHHRCRRARRPVETIRPPRAEDYHRFPLEGMTRVPAPTLPLNTPMKPDNYTQATASTPQRGGRHRSGIRRTILGGALALALTATSWGQGAARSPGDLVKYDRNGNGRLDAEELSAKQADEARAAVAVRPETSGEVVTMSPFEVVGDNRGYYGANTMSGTRINSKIEDLGSSISVVTKEQMADFAMLDINDIFAYEASTEGSGNYTDFAFNQSFQPSDNLADNPNTANRVRGLTSANVAYGGFETSRRVPLDPINSDAVEISRGPNSNLFGLGNASGTANSVPSSANLGRNRTELQLRAELFGRFDGEAGYRQSLDANRVLQQDKLAIRLSQVFQRSEYNRQPSGVKAERYNGMVKYRPFPSTSISASHQYFHQYGRRPNSITPRDGVSQWLAVGAPTWDPVTNTAYINGSPVNRNGQPVASLGAGVPNINAGAAVFNSAFQTTGRGSSLLYIDSSGVSYWTAPRGTTTPDALLTTTASNNQPGNNYMLLNPQTLRRTQPLWTSDGAVSSKSLYDWSTINAASMNNFDEVTGTSLVTVDHLFFNTPRQLLAVQLGWFREDSPRQFRDYPTGSAGSTYLYVDPNMRRLDGSPNPFFLRPYFGMTETSVIDRPLTNDTYRTQLAYKLDLRQEKGWKRWLGLHQFSGYGEYKHNQSRAFYYQLAMLDDHAWLPAGTPRATSSRLPGDTLPQDGASPTGSRSYRLYLVGDNQGFNVDHAPFTGSLAGTYNYTWGNFAAGRVTHEPTQLGLAASANGTAGSQNSLKIQKTLGIVWQSYLWQDRLVTTLGLRKDRVYTKAGIAAQLLPDAMSHDYEWDQQWEAGDYKFNEGETKTAGAVFKLTSWLSAHANKSDSFIPANPAINLHGKLLPNPQGKGEDWGFSLNLLNGKLILRANQFTTRTTNDRSGTSSTLATRSVKMDVFDGNNSRSFSLDVRARQWLQVTQPNLTGAALDAAVAREMQMDPQMLEMLQTSVNFGGLPISQGQDALSKGKEIEIYYNPTRHWTMKVNVTESETIQAAIAQDLLDYLNERMPVWRSIIDKETGQPWYTTSYAGVQTPDRYLPGNVDSPLAIAQQTVGKSLPQVRKYRANLSTNFYLRGITEHRILRSFNVGGAVRWEDKGSIGYYGLQSLPAIITDLDRDRPIYDQGRFYFDLLAAYRTKIWSGKVGMTVQLNIRNIQEGGRLQPVSAFPDGTPNAYRIVDPRQFILTATFDL